jgi:peptide/nickel transport system permease protein
MSEKANRPSLMASLKRAPLIPIVLLLPIVVFGLFGPWLVLHEPTSMDPSHSLMPPLGLGGERAFPLGTDHLGRDIASKIIIGARTSLLVALIGVAVAGFVGVLLGMIAGYFGGWADEVIMRFVDAQMSIPAILLTILLSGALGPGLMTIIICIAIVFWTQYARIIRGETLSIKERDFVVLAKIAGCGTPRILWKHVLPNLFSTGIVLATLQLGRAIIIEASITFLGLGIQPPQTAWGLMIAEGRLYLGTEWWLPTFAGVAIVVTVLGSNMMGDWLRDWLDPKLRQI